MDSGIIDILITDKRGVIRPEIKSSLWFYALTRNCQGYRSKYNAEMEKSYARLILEAGNSGVNLLDIISRRGIHGHFDIGKVSTLVYNEPREKWLRIMIRDDSFLPWGAARVMSDRVNAHVRITAPYHDPLTAEHFKTVFFTGYVTVSPELRGRSFINYELQAIQPEKESFVRKGGMPFGIDYTYDMASTDASLRKYGRLWN